MTYLWQFFYIMLHMIDKNLWNNLCQLHLISNTVFKIEIFMKIMAGLKKVYKNPHIQLFLKIDQSRIFRCFQCYYYFKK